MAMFCYFRVMQSPIHPKAMNARQLNSECHIGIVGGGTAGWMSAATLKRRLGCRVTVIESSRIPGVGVGEATIPAMVDWIENMGIDEAEFIRRTGASYKLGIRFDHWVNEDHRYWHPFGMCGPEIDRLDLVHHWSRAKSLGWIDQSIDYTDFSLQTRLCEASCGPRDCDGRLLVDNYAFHLDAGKLAAFLKEIAIDEGVEHRIGDVTGARCDTDGNLTSVLVDGQEPLTADWYLDCSGFAGVLIGKVLDSPWDDWSNELLCDRAVTCRKAKSVAPDGDLPPYTISTGMDAGWSWQIPLQANTGCGYVYSSSHISDEDARCELSQLVGIDVEEASFKTVDMRIGMRPKAWTKNCIAIGLAAGFVEPLESTGIFLVQRALDEFVECQDADEFNDRMGEVYHQTRDFVLMHYVVSKRRDTAFWQDASNVALPDSLERLLDVYQREGRVLMPPRHPTFAEANHHFILAPAGVMPGPHSELPDTAAPHVRPATSGILSAIANQQADVVRLAASHAACIENRIQPYPNPPFNGRPTVPSTEMLCS